MSSNPSENSSVAARRGGAMTTGQIAQMAEFQTGSTLEFAGLMTKDLSMFLLGTGLAIVIAVILS